MRNLLFILTAFFITACDNTALLLDCVDGCSVSNGADGRDGATGAQGPAGQDGINGASCSVAGVPSGALVSCTDGTSELVLNGSDGTDATPVETIELCPALTGGSFKEHLFRISGALYGVYASGSRIGLAKLGPGNWVTTDGRNCHFTISILNQVSY